MAAVTSPARHAASLATSASNRERRQSKVHRAMEWPKPLSVRSSVTTSASVRARMHRPSSTSYQLVVTAPTIKPVRIVITVENIVVVRAGGILDAEKVIGLVLRPPV